MNDNETSTAIQTREAAIAELSTINNLHQQACNLAGTAAGNLIDLAETVRLAGAELIEYKRTAKSDGWKQMFLTGSDPESAFVFSEETADKYMRVARTRRDPITTIQEAIAVNRECMMVTGELPFPDGHKSQALHSFNFVGMLAKKAFDFKAAWGKQLKTEPVTEWSEARKEAARDELRWFAERYVEIGGRL